MQTRRSAANRAIPARNFARAISRARSMQAVVVLAGYHDTLSSHQEPVIKVREQYPSQFRGLLMLGPSEAFG